MIEYVNITRNFGNKKAVDNLNLVVKGGELFSLLGPNGAGKTTTLKLTAGIMKPTTGQIHIKGIDIDKYPEKAKSIISFIPDQPFSYPELSGKEFIYFVGRIFGMDKEDIEKNTAEIIQKLEIEEWIDSPCKEYSHGMLQKVMFAQAFIHNPDIIIIDEPMVGLDPRSGKIIKRILRKKVKEGKTVLLSTHSLYLAEEISDRIGIINKGKLIACDTIINLREKFKAEGKNLEDIYFELTEKDGYWQKE